MVCGGNQTRNSQTTKVTYGNHVCVSVCVPWGLLCVRWVRGGRGFNKGTGLVQGCQSDCLGTWNLMGSRWEPPDWTSPSKPATSLRITFPCLPPRAALWVYTGIWWVISQIKVTFSFNGTLKLFIDHRKMCFVMLQRDALQTYAWLILEVLLFFSWSSNVNILCVLGHCAHGVSGNLNETAVSWFTESNRCLSCYLSHPEQALTSSSSAECQFQRGRGIYLQVRHWINWSAESRPPLSSGQHEVMMKGICQPNVFIKQL